MEPQSTGAKAGNEQRREEMSEEEKAVHIRFMREAIAMGELALQSDETPVGCVFVLDGTIIGRGMNATNRTLNGTRHAEFEAINDILTTPVSASPDDGQPAETQAPGQMKFSPAILRQCDLYVTVEPCIMCASLLRQFGVRKVYYGASNEKFGGTGGVLSIHRANGRVPEEGEVLEREADDYEVSGGWLREEAILLLRRFYVQENGKAPVPKKRKDRTVKEVEPLE